MYRYTTPTIILNVTNKDFDMEQIEICHVTIKSGNGTEYICENPEIDTENKKIYFTLDQEQTAAFQTGSIKIQARIKLYNGNVIASGVMRTSMYNVLEETIL